jgi:serine/threonine protein kinase
MALRNSDDDKLSIASPVSAKHEALVASVTTSTIGNTRQIAQGLADGYSFGRYQIVRLIAIGGMSEVYEAIHNGLDKRVALKVLRPDLAQNTEARERFVTEGVNAARIRHTHVVDVTDVGIVDGLPYLVMSLLEGEDLGQLYARQGPMAVSDVADLLLPVACAVAVGHSHGIVHRDLKPDNIFLHREGCRLIPKVLDFGVSRAMHGRRITPNARVFGTPHYMSPEQARGEAIDARTDQYALGVILYEGVTGRLPRDAENPLELLHAVAFDSFQLPSTHVELPPEVENVIVRAMSHEPEARFPSMREFALALLPFASEASRDYWSVELNSLDESTGGSALGSVAPPPAQPAELATEVEPAATTESDLLAFDVTSPDLRESETGERAERDSLQPQIGDAIPRPRRPRSVFWIGAAAGAALGLAGAWITGQSKAPRPTAASASLTSGSAAAVGASEAGVAYYEVDVHVVPPTAAVLLDGQPVATGHYRARLPRDGKVHELRASADGFIASRHIFRDEAPSRDIQLIPDTAASAAVPEQSELAALGEVPRAPSSRASSASPRVRAGTRLPAREVARHVEPEPQIGAIESDRPRVRIVDEFEPHVRIIE